MANYSKETPILIFGASGFIGGSLARTLDGKGYQTITPSSGECNLLDAKQLFRYLSSLKMPVKIAFCASIIVQKGNSFETMVKNIQMVQSLSEVIEHFSVSSVVFLSSTSVYNYSSEPLTENTPVSPQSLYGISKSVCEQLFDITRAFKMPVTILRIPGVYGAGDQQRSIVSVFLNQLMKDGQAHINGDGETLRDYVIVDDVCRLIEHFLSFPCNEKFNVATGHSLSIKELVAILGEALNISPHLIFNEKRDNPNQDLIYNTAHLRKHIPNFQFTPIHEGVTSLVNSFQYEKTK